MESLNPDSILASDYSALCKFFMLLYLDARYLSLDEKQKDEVWNRVERKMEEKNE